METPKQLQRGEGSDFIKDRPKEVDYAVYLIYISTAWTIIVRIALTALWPSAQGRGELYASVGFVFGDVILRLLIVVVLGRALMRGSSLAHVLTLVLILLELVFQTCYGVMGVEGDPMRLVGFLLLWIPVLMRLIAINQLSKRASSEWFLSMKSRQSPDPQQEPEVSGTRQGARWILVLTLPFVSGAMLWLGVLCSYIFLFDPQLRDVSYSLSHLSYEGHSILPELRTAFHVGVVTGLGFSLGAYFWDSQRRLSLVVSRICGVIWLIYWGFTSFMFSVAAFI